VSQSQLIIVLSYHGLTLRRYQIIVEIHGALSYEILHENYHKKEFSWLSVDISELEIESKSIIHQHSTYGISILTLVDDLYPKNLLEMDDCPLVLYYQGDISLLHYYDTCLTVVGSRNNSKYSEMVMGQILPDCINHGLIIVSGLAEGVDGLAHAMALEEGGKTIAVIGSGLDDENFYPKSNLQLRSHIVEKGGLVISEYSLGTAPKAFHFPRRNRILAALSPIVWVVEASIKSGSMTTVRFAQKYKKKVVTNPGNLLVDQCSGNIELMKQGAGCVFDSNDIILLYKDSSILHANLSLKKEISHPIFAYFTSLSMTVDELLISSQLSFTHLSFELSMAELEGAVKNVGENVWQKNPLS
jgi:DNA processing protein